VAGDIRKSSDMDLDKDGDRVVLRGDHPRF
jgi:hypothetical protein